MSRKAMITKAFVLALAVLCLALATAANANVALSPLFSDHMVLQRNKPIPVYGTAAVGENITVTFNGQSASTTADAQGNWQVFLPSMAAKTTAGNLVITGTNTVTIADVLIGDVWVCSGQSNMAMGLGSCNRQTEDVSTANFPGIRTFWAPLNNLGEPTKNLTGNWSVCTPSSAGGFSATAFYFGRRIYQDQGATVPIGLLMTTVGGTCIDPWLAPEGCSDIPALQPLYSQSILPWGPFSLFNGMVYPLAPYAVKGGIWYQGESMETTTQSTDSYYLKEKALIQGWQRLWGGDDFPFYIVQIANYATVATSVTPELPGSNWADIRIQQANILGLPNTGMAVIMDIGETDNIHPTDKLDVGERLALWALKNDYGHSTIVPSGPILKDAVVSGNKIVCSFDYVGNGLMVGSKTPYVPAQEVTGGTLQRFSIAGSNGTWYAANATIVGNTVEVTSTSVTNPTQVAYACWMNPLGANLYNKVVINGVSDGLPASPFYVDATAAGHYTVTASAGTGGSISPLGATTYLKRTTPRYTITPNAGYYVQDVKVDGVSIGAAVKSYTFDPLYANHTIAATFAATAPNYTITTTANPGGSISPSGSVTVAQGGAKTFTILPNAGVIATMTVDGAPVGQRKSFTFSDVRSNHTIGAVFSCPMNAQAGYGGTITPSGSIVAAYGGSQTYTITPMAGFALSKVVVDGVNVGAVTSYTFNNITTSHTISASFAGVGGTGSVPQQNSMLFSCLTDTLPASGNISSWATYIPAGKTLSILGTPTVSTIDDRKFAHNVYNDYDGFNFGNYSTSIACNGASIVAVAKPTRFGVDANWFSIVDVFYDRLVLGIMNGSGRVCVRRNGTLDYSDTAIPDGQTTVLSLVVQPDGTYKVWANGTQIMNNTGTSTMTSLVPNVAGGFANAINVGRGIDNWSTFNGEIGDVFVYKTNLSDTDRVQLETYVVNRLAGGSSGTAYPITASAGKGGSINPNGTVMVNSGTNQTFTISPSTDYAIASVLVDGNNVGAVTSYAFNNVTTSHTISATFSGGPSAYTITATAGSGGSISPSGAVSVPTGTNKTFTITPDSGCSISSVTVDGTNMGPITTYTFSNVIDPHTISATFINSAGVPRTDQLLFSCVTDTLPASGATGNWATYLPTGQTLTMMQSPTVETINGVKWEKNLRGTGTTPWVSTDNDGFKQGSYDSPIAVNGATIVVAAKPLRHADTDPWNSIVDIFYNRLVLGIVNGTGKVCVWRNGAIENSSAVIPENQITVLSLVVQPDGTYKVWANGTQIMNNTTTTAGDGSSYAMTSLVPGVPGAYAKSINIGRNDPDWWTTYNGYIGDVYVYKVALTDIERQQLEAQITSKVIPPTYQDVASVAALKAKTAGTLVRLTGTATVIYAPTNSSSARSTTFFYIGESKALGGLKVVDKTSDSLVLGNQVTNLIGYVRKPANKEMYLELTTDPTGTGNTPIAPVGMNNKSTINDAKALTNAVKVWGKVKSITGTTSFTINDGYGPDITVMVNGVALPSPFDTTRTVVVTGVVTKDGTVAPVIYAQEVTAP